MWLSDSRCGEVVEAAWRSCVARDSDSEIIGKIDKCGKDLSWWNCNVFGNVRMELKKKRDLLIEEEDVAVRTGSNLWIWGTLDRTSHGANIIQMDTQYGRDLIMDWLPISGS